MPPEARFSLQKNRGQLTLARLHFAKFVFIMEVRVAHYATKETYLLLRNSTHEKIEKALKADTGVCAAFHACPCPSKISKKEREHLLDFFIIEYVKTRVDHTVSRGSAEELADEHDSEQKTTRDRARTSSKGKRKRKRKKPHT